MLNPQVESTNFKIKDATTKDFDIGVFLVLLFKSKWLIGSYFIIVFSVVFFIYDTAKPFMNLNLFCNWMRATQ